MNERRSPVLDRTVDVAAETGLFARASHFETLWRSWERVRANRGAAGGDRVTVEAFERRASNSISRLAHALRSGRYRPGPARRVEIPKRSGGTRPLDIPCVVDRVAQGAVALVLSPVLEPEFEESSFAYRPGRGVADAVSRVASLRRDGYRFVVDGDIVRYFERIPHERLLVKIERHVDDPRLVDLIALWLEHHAWDGRGLPQGSPLSPLLANLYLDEVDEAIAGRGVRLVRFADDFVLLCKTEAAAAGALERMRDLLAEHGLELHPDKTRIVSFDQGMLFLGHLFVRSMVLRQVTADDTPAEDALAALAAAGSGTPVDEADEDDASAPRGRWASHQNVLYVLEPGRRLGVRGEAFEVRERETVLLALPHKRVDRIEIGPGIDVDMAAFELAAASDTVLARVDGRGATIGRWHGPGGDRAARQLGQAALVLDDDRRTALARILVAGRIRNQRVLLKRLDRGRRDPEIARIAADMARVIRKVERGHPDRAAAMGHEGEAAALYWPGLARILGAGPLFSGLRRRRRGADPLNILLDVTASLLARDVAVAIGRVGLHPGFGVLHQADDDEEALVYDLMEEFRAPLAEALAMSLLLKRTLREEHFRDVEGAMRLTRDGWAACIRGYEGWLARPVVDPSSGTRVLWRGLLAAQVAAFARAMDEGAAPYRPYRMDY